MKNGTPFFLLLLAVAAMPSSFGQSEHAIPLPGANLSRSLPVLRVAGNGVLYAAYRSSNLLGKSETLQLLSYDLKSGVQLHRNTIPVPAVNGNRAAGGLYL